MKVAIVHDWLTNMGGSERIILLLHEMFPEAPVYTAVYNKKNMPDAFKKINIKTTFLQKIPFAVKKYQSFLPLMPLAFEQLDLSGYDLVISSASSCAKGVITKSGATHICYCHTPMRYGWDMYHQYIKEKSLFKKAFIGLLMNYIRMWDRLAADRVDFFLANSQNTKKRIRKHYRRKAEVIYPPVNTSFYTPLDSKQTEDYFLIVSRLVPYKKVDLAVRAFNELNLPLVVIGNGSEYKKLKAMSKKNITFLGRVSDEETKHYYRTCKALIFTAEEDFGIVPVEAQSCGKPVIAYGAGGALETVIHGKTGMLFPKQTKKSLVAAVKSFNEKADAFDMEAIRRHTEKFSQEIFKAKMMAFIVEKYKENSNGDEYHGGS